LKGLTIMRRIIKTKRLNGYDYTMYDNGTIVATGRLQDKTAARNNYNQRTAGGKSRLSTDHGGHLVPACTNGSPDKLNITAQDAKVNTRDIRAVERNEKAAQKAGDVIMTERIAHCFSDPDRPDAYMINDTVIGSDGKTRLVSSSFTNTDMSQYDENYIYDSNSADDSFAAVKHTGITEEELYKALGDNDIPDDYAHSWTGCCSAENQMTDFGKDSTSCDNTYDECDVDSDNDCDSNSMTLSL